MLRRVTNVIIPNLINRLLDSEQSQEYITDPPPTSFNSLATKFSKEKKKQKCRVKLCLGEKLTEGIINSLDSCEMGN